MPEQEDANKEVSQALQAYQEAVAEEESYFGGQALTENNKSIEVSMYRHLSEDS